MLKHMTFITFHILVEFGMFNKIFIYLASKKSIELSIEIEGVG